MNNDVYAINILRRGTNNFCELLTRSSNPTFIKPVSENVTAQQQQVNLAPTSLTMLPSIPQSHVRPVYPTVTYTPQSINSRYEPLNSNFNLY
jgi:hypothetical protein